MNGYAAAARIRSASPHLVGRTSNRDDPVPAVVVADADALLVTSPDDPLPAPTPSLGERWLAARERWAQLTFYLTDPNSWR